MNKIMAAVVAAALACRAACGAASADTVPLRASIVPAAPALAAWVALDQGYFTEHGLAVTLTPVQNVSLVPGLLGKQIDVGMVTTVDLVKAASAGLPIVAVAGNHMEVAGSTTNVLVARKGAGITSIKDFPGKVVATPSVGAILQVALLHWMVKDGVDPNAIQAVELPFSAMADQMAAGRIDVAVSAEPFAGKMLAAGNVDLGNQLLQVANPVSATLWIADRDWAASHAPVIASWVAALDEARGLIGRDPATARAILVKYTHLPPPVVASLPMPHFETALRPADIEVWIGVLQELHQMQAPVSAAALVVGQ
jgi:NitT/TauT family transport system substrate-binding protein